MSQHHQDPDHHQHHHHHHHHHHGHHSSSAPPPSTPCRCFVELANGTLLVTAIVLGVVKGSMCPIENFIPKSLIGFGIAGVFLLLTDKLQLCCDPYTFTRRIVVPCIKFVLATFAIICLATLCVLTARSANSRGFCDHALYAFSIFLICFLLVQLVVAFVYWMATSWRRNRREDDDYGKPPRSDMVL